MYQTMEEIERNFDGNWVFMINCKDGEHHSIAGGEVIAATKNKERIVELWKKDNVSRTIFRYIGSMPEGMGLIL